MSEKTVEKRLIKGPQDFAAGIVMVIFGALAYYFSRELPLGKGANLGPGSFPFGVSILIMIFGAIIAFNGLTKEGEKFDFGLITTFLFFLFFGGFYWLFQKGGFPAYAVIFYCFFIFGFITFLVKLKERKPFLKKYILKGPLYILTSISFFALTVRPLGLLVAGPLLILSSAFAMDEKINFKELFIFTVVMTAFCIGLFKFALKQPIPLAPWLGL